MAIFDHPPVFENKQFLTDSRYLADPTNTVFFAIRGERHNGHDFIRDLASKGIHTFVVEDDSLSSSPELVTFLEQSTIQAYRVKSSIQALQKCAITHRKLFTIPIIGITGSNGKTIVKEWLWTLLNTSLAVVKSPRSYNSQIGVPLSIAELKEGHELGIFEAGISQQGEMQTLQEIISPEIGIFTNIGSAHNSGFRSIKQKVSEKIRLFRASKILVFCKDYKEIQEEVQILLKAVNPKLQLISWSKSQLGSHFIDVVKSGPTAHLSVYFEGDVYEFELPFSDDASIENISHCIFLVLYLKKSYFPKIDIQGVQLAISNLRSIAMRLELKQGVNENYIIDDTYNNDLAGIKMALNFMSQYSTKRDKVLILSDVLQAGISDRDWVVQLSELLISQGLKLNIFIGPKLLAHKEILESQNIGECKFYSSTDEFLKFYDFEDLQKKLILIKGARIFGFERVVNSFIRQVHGTVLEINLNAITHNLNYYRNKVGKDTKIMVMVKAFAYGSGSPEIASLLQYHRVDYLSVAYPDEGVVLRRNGIKLPI
ncbi:MAG: Mur ligase family protein, partial [Leadbetterella sp.]